MLTTSQRLFSLITLLFLLTTSNPLIAGFHKRSHFSDREYSYSESTKTFPKKKSETPSLFGACAAVACVVGAVVFGGLVLSGLFNVSDETYLRNCDNRYFDIKNGYAQMFHSYISNDDLEDHIIGRFVHTTYRVLSYKRQLENDINQINNYRKGVAQRIRTLAKKMHDYDQDDSFNYILARATKRSLEILHDKQEVLLEQLRALLVRVVRLPRFHKEEREKRKEERERERIHAMSRPQVYVHGHCHNSFDHLHLNCNCGSESLTVHIG